ncbi:hypothetical protein OIU78_023729 [Salix suchowensis]|nr:hypothetical protein OIU78_023729 [Salix suchowensis]
MAVHQWVRKNKLDLFGILEPKVLASNLETINQNMDNQEWEYRSNIQAINPCRILVGWNPNKLLVDNVRSEEQWLTCKITNKITKDQFWVKEILKKWHSRNTSQISKRVEEAKRNWDEAQILLDRNPSSMDKRDDERRCAGIYNRLSMDEEAFFKQKSRIQYMELGDRNTAFFHKSLVHRQTRNRIQELRDERGNVSADPKSIARIVESYYKDLLTSTANRQHYHRQNLFARRISDGASDQAARQFSDDEIKEALFSILDNKSPGPDGFTSCFFKKC